MAATVAADASGRPADDSAQALVGGGSVGFFYIGDDVADAATQTDADAAGWDDGEPRVSPAGQVDLPGKRYASAEVQTMLQAPPSEFVAAVYPSTVDGYLEVYRLARGEAVICDFLESLLPGLALPAAGGEEVPVGVFAEPPAGESGGDYPLLVLCRGDVLLLKQVPGPHEGLVAGLGVSAVARDGFTVAGKAKHRKAAKRNQQRLGDVGSAAGIRLQNAWDVLAELDDGESTTADGNQENFVFEKVEQASDLPPIAGVAAAVGTLPQIASKDPAEPDGHCKSPAAEGNLGSLEDEKAKQAAALPPEGAAAPPAPFAPADEELAQAADELSSYVKVASLLPGACVGALGTAVAARQAALRAVLRQGGVHEPAAGEAGGGPPPAREDEVLDTLVCIDFLLRCGVSGKARSQAQCLRRRLRLELARLS